MYRTNESQVFLVRWVARSIAIALFLFFGAFFVEHLSWLFNYGERPPASVWLLQAVHLLMLVGFIMVLKWEAAGSVLIVVSSLIFLSQTAGERFLPMFAICIIPTLLFLTCRWKDRRQVMLL